MREHIKAARSSASGAEPDVGIPDMKFSCGV
jgi:hypothetical protein